MANIGRLSSIRFSLLLNRLVVWSSVSSPRSSQPKLLEGSSSQLWTSAIICSVGSHVEPPLVTDAVPLAAVLGHHLLESRIGRIRDTTPFLEALHNLVLNPAHHGSSTSSSEEFLEAVDPAAAVISVGDENRFGHPDAEVVDRLTGHVSEERLFTTRDHGAITFTSDGRRLHAQTSR